MPTNTHRALIRRTYLGGPDALVGNCRLYWSRFVAPSKGAGLPVLRQLNVQKSANEAGRRWFTVGREHSNLPGGKTLGKERGGREENERLARRLQSLTPFSSLFHPPRDERGGKAVVPVVPWRGS